ncbi:MAG: hypothetical protein HY898_30175 [Deltaproteobacteria bacterium]|nr:hypothetical protein [Deltaproteobacteria bacterium]
MQSFQATVLGLVIVLCGAGCGKSEPQEQPKPQSTTAAAATTPAAQPKKADKPAVKKSLPADKKPHPVPSEWAILVDIARGYGFAVPEGTKDHHESKDGVDIYIAQVAKPHDIQVMGAAYKDKTLTKDDLLKDAKHVLEVLGNTDVHMGKTRDITDDYAVADATCKHSGAAWKVRVLVATDVTDNYLLLVGSPEAEFSANEQTIDTIWGSFDMLSGGASGTSH